MMNPSLRVVTTIPLDVLWTETRELSARRSEYLQEKEITELFKSGHIQFVIANVGDKLNWIDIESCYKFYKSIIKGHIADDPNYIDISSFIDDFCYLASLWLDNTEIRIVLLEKYH